MTAAVGQRPPSEPAAAIRRPALRADLDSASPDAYYRVCYETAKMEVD